MGFSVKEIDAPASIHEGIVELAGAELGVESFGLQVLDVPTQSEHDPEHCGVGGERVSLFPGRMLDVRPVVRS